MKNCAHSDVLLSESGTIKTSCRSICKTDNNVIFATVLD